ncbi:hypothetical protein CKM354_000122500 [Cercospora kikuchii]|uniref:Uncharacterized protein n=1 Tax=Cercospora kikuchii TaxID=84275 RepID=A0A9P3CCD9_9PEZI|nr:uncharacterized protein CKM354_000122500 [Cercospora kikuchii]GIZ37790.1 hypothetical protein CKM354_000122500 [Cercospora kikuchii]
MGWEHAVIVTIAVLILYSISLLAAATFWYEFYYDVVKQGRYTWKIRELHEQYGPIVRINPYEVHINDPDYYNEIYTGPSKR